MFQTLIALVSAPLWLATPKRKPARVKRARPAARPTRAPRAPGKRAAVPLAHKKSLPVRVEPPANAVESPPPPPPPSAPIQAPGLFSPQPDEATESLMPNFRWFYVGGASHYQLVWSADASFHRQHILLTNQTAAQLPPEQVLEPATRYVWRVRGGNAGGWGPWSPTRSFHTPEK